MCNVSKIYLFREQSSMLHLLTLNIQQQQLGKVYVIYNHNKLYSQGLVDPLKRAETEAG